MKVSIPGLFRNAGFGPATYSLGELAANLRELRDRHRKGDGAKALDEFFDIYVFGDERAAEPQSPVECE